MSGFLYAIKRSDAPPRDMTDPAIAAALSEAGLPHLEGMTFSVRKQTFKGESVWLYTPKGFGNGAQEARPGVDLHKQKWIDCGKFHLGMWTPGGFSTSPVTPQDVSRRDQYHSVSVQLLGNVRWRLPVIPVTASGQIVTTDLPSEFRIGEDGQPRMVIEPFFSGLETLARKYWDYKNVAVPIEQTLQSLGEQIDQCVSAMKLESERESPREAELTRISETIARYSQEQDSLSEKFNAAAPSELERAIDCVTVLSKNYHVSMYEVGMLGLLTSRTIWRIITYSFLDKAAVDLQEIAEKKGSTALDMPLIDSGEAILVASQDIVLQPQI